MRLNRLVALGLFVVLASVLAFPVFAQESTEEAEATEEVTQEVTEEATEEPADNTDDTDDDDSNDGTYVVQRGDNLFRIALRNGLTTRQLAEANNITNPALIYVGQRLIIPGRAGSVTQPTPEPTEAPDEPTTPTPPETTGTYVVQPGDSLYRIAVRNQTTVGELARLNPGIANRNIIFVGQRLNLPSGSQDTNTGSSDETTTDGTDSTGSTLSVTFDTGVEVFLGADNIDALASQVDQLGVNTVKITVDWRDVEAQEGTMTFDVVDQAVSSFDAVGTDIIVTLVGSPDWAIPSATDLALAQNAMIPPDDLNDFGAFAGTVAERYSGVVDAYEIWSDPNIRINWMTPDVTLRPDGFPDARLAIEVRYIDLLEAAYNAIKAADPNAQVITAGLAPTGNDDFYNSIDTFVFFEALLNQGALNFSDAIGVHVDGFANAPDAECCGTLDDGIQFNETYHFFFNVMLENHREILDRNGGESTPLVVTRVGWGTAENASTAPQQESSYLSDNTAGEQAQFAVTAFELAAGRGDVSAMILYNLNGCSVSGSTACYYSMIGADGSARPVFSAVQGLDLSSDDMSDEPDAEVTEEPAPEATEESSGG